MTGQVSITARDFLSALFGDAEKVWTCAWAGQERWTGGWGLSRLGSLDGQDAYFCIARLDPGATRRSYGHVEAEGIVVFDDVGTKGDRKRLAGLLSAAGLEPTFRIETSPGNETWGLLLDRWIPADDSELRTRLRLLRSWIGPLGLGDGPVAEDSVRYIRLPAGVNSKAKHRERNGGKPVPVRLVGWNPSARASVEAILRALVGPDWQNRTPPPSLMSGDAHAAGVAVGALRRCADMRRPEPLIRLAEAIGLRPVQTRPGVVEAICPNVAAHTQDGREETGFALLGDGIAHCCHSSCAGLRTPDFRQMMMDRYDEMISAREFLGLPVEYPDARSFWTACAFGDGNGNGNGNADATDKETANSVADEADALARRQAARAAEREAEIEAGWQAICQRYAYVVALDRFFDCETGALLTRTAFGVQPDVRAVHPPVPVGARSADALYLRRPEAQFATKPAYLPGETRRIVPVTSPAGSTVECVNTWRPSPVRRRPGRPEAFLRHLETVIPADDYRGWILDWLAYHLQNQTARASTIPVVQGAQGLGKDLLLAPIKACFGQHNCVEVGADQLASGFSGWLTARFIYLTELRVDNRVYEKLKAFTGIPQGGIVTVNEKFQRPYDVTFYGVFFAFTNDLDAFRGLAAGDRRFQIYLSPARPREPAYYTEIAARLGTEEERGRVLDLLLSRDVSRFNPHGAAPGANTAQDAARYHSLTDAAQAAYDLLCEPQFAGRRVLRLDELGSVIRARRTDLRASNAAIRQGALAAGCRPLHGGAPVSVNGSSVRLYTGPAMTADEAADAAANWPPARCSREYALDLARVAQQSPLVLVPTESASGRQD